MKQILLGAFEMNALNLTSQGLWAHPEQHTLRYKELSYWVDLARLLERGGFDYLFLADSYGYPTIGGEVSDVTFEQGVEIPKNDPMLLIPAMAAATSILSYVVTTSTSFEHPVANARRFATLDHLTRGRIAWNVVTTSNAVSSQLFGRTQAPHDERYAIAQDFLTLSYKLFEGSWEDGAVLADAATRRYADPRRVHPVRHDGPYFSTDGYFGCEPSPQRTPVICQAGASSTGRAFAAANAELVFLQGKDAGMLAQQVTALRAEAAAAGRDPASLKAVSGLSVITAPSRAQAQEKLEEYLSWVDPEAMRVYFAHMTGIDLAALDPDASFGDLTTDGGRTQVERYRSDSVRSARADFLRHGMRELILLGTPEDVTEQVEAMVTETDLDGFNYTPFVTPGSYTDLIEHVVPALREAGLVGSHRRAGTFRQVLFGPARSHVAADHPASRFSAAVHRGTVTTTSH